jgi:hypothetical protein
MQDPPLEAERLLLLLELGLQLFQLLVGERAEVGEDVHALRLSSSIVDGLKRTTTRTVNLN